MEYGVWAKDPVLGQLRLNLLQFPFPYPQSKGMNKEVQKHVDQNPEPSEDFYKE